MGTPYAYDPNFNGVDENRKCTDCCFLIFFILFLCGMVALLIVALTKSNYKYIYIPTDHRGLLCGYNNKKLSVENAENLPDLTDRKYLFWVRPGKPGYSRSFCVAECPNEGFFTEAFESFKPDMKGLSQTSYCGSFDGKNIHPTVENYSSQDPDRYFCPYYTEKMLQRCFPTTKTFNNIIDAAENITAAVNEFGESMKAVSYATQAVQDLYHTYWMIAVCVLIALVLSLLWLLALRCCTAVFVWLAVILSAVGLGGLTYMCYRQWKDEFKNHATVEKYSFGFVSEDLNSKTFKVLFWIMIVIDVIFILLIIFLFSRIKLSIKIISLVSRIFANAPSLFFFPAIQYLILFIWWVYVIGVAVVLFGAGTFERGIVQNNNDPPVDKLTMKYDTIIQGFAIYHFVGFLWVSFFIVALGEMTIAGVIAQFFFTREEDRKNLPGCMVTRSFFRSLRFHTGSLALGSFIITICAIIRIIIEYIDQKTKASQSSIAKCLIKCCKCCFWCLEKFLKFLNRNAYVMIAIHGYSFFQGAKNAFQLILRNCVRVATLNWVGDFTLFLGRVFVSGGVTALSLYIFKTDKDVQFFVVPAVITFVMCYLACGAFTGVFEIAIDSTFLCFMEDEERNDSSQGRESYSSSELKSFMKNDVAVDEK